MKMRTFAAVAMAGIMTAAMSLTSFAGGLVMPKTPAGPAEVQQKLPAFRFLDEAPYMNTILDYMKNTEAKNYEAGDVMIPNFLILRVDESNPEDVRVWGDFQIMNYDLQGDNLFCKNGGSYPGLFHLRKTAAGYEVTGTDMVGDGSSYTPDVNRIFGADQDLLNAFNNLGQIKEQYRKDAIRRYVLQNNLPVNTYQDYGWDKVSVR